MRHSSSHWLCACLGIFINGVLGTRGIAGCPSEVQSFGMTTDSTQFVDNPGLLLMDVFLHSRLGHLQVDNPQVITSIKYVPDQF